MSALDFGIFDGDNHHCEPRELELHFLDDTFASFDRTVRPGSLREFLESPGSDRLVEPESVEMAMDPAFVSGLPTIAGRPIGRLLA